MSNVLRFADGVMVEIAPNTAPGAPVSGKAVERVKQAFEAAAGVAGTALKAIVSSTRPAVQQAGVKEVEIEFGVAFSMEGDIYITKVKTEANLKITVTISAGP